MAQNFVCLPWKINHKYRIWLKLQFLMSYRFQQSQNVSVKSFHDTETDPETHCNADKNASKKFQVSHFRDVPQIFQRKGRVILRFPIKEIQFQQFCKQLNTKEIFLWRDLWERELYGKEKFSSKGWCYQRLILLIQLNH